MGLLVEDEKITTEIDPYNLPILSFSSGLMIKQTQRIPAYEDYQKK
ncbi:hypothetical protein BH18THE2_BH18THE2_24940 [soil metagenome]